MNLKKTPEELFLDEESSDLRARRFRLIYEGGSDPLVELTLSDWWESIPKYEKLDPISGEIEIKEKD